MILCYFSDTSKIKPCHNLDNNRYLLCFFSFISLAMTDGGGDASSDR